MKLLVITVLLCFMIAVTCADWKIVGGTDASNGEYPFLVSIRYQNKHVCGGTIINNRWILTAAHCFLFSKYTRQITVIVGTNELSGKGGLEYPVVHKAGHEDFNLVTGHADIGLLRLRYPINFNRRVLPARLAFRDFVRTNDTTRLAGWGTLKFGGRAADKVQEIQLKVYDKNQCKARWQRLNTGKVPDDGNICTFNRENQGICHGDSGSPLTIGNVVIGLASFVWPCARGEPDVFTKVSNYIPWIFDEIEKFQCD